MNLLCERIGGELTDYQCLLQGVSFVSAGSVDEDLSVDVNLFQALKMYVNF
jgi:hypothetical protein